MKKVLLFLSTLPLICFSQEAEKADYSLYFNQAYQQYPALPKGALEAVAYTNTHIHHINHDDAAPENCMGMPGAYGVMGLIKDGKNYFINNLALVSQLSGISETEIINDPQKHILAYAAALNSVLASSAHKKKNSVEAIAEALTALSELPRNDKGQIFALNTQLYSYLTFLNDEVFQKKYMFPSYQFDLRAFFGEENFRVLSASHVVVSENNVQDTKGNTFKGEDSPSVLSSDYAPALWNAAASCNYSTGRSSSISAVAIHNVEGTYAGCISWFQNCNAKVSAHYVIRSSDGQITQMVLEKNTAQHVANHNSYTIGIEHEGYANQTGWYTTAMYNSSAGLVKDICNSGYGINPATCYNGPACNCQQTLSTSIKIKGHQHFNITNGKVDPGPNWDWNKFYNLINGTPPPPPPAGPVNDNCSAAIALTPNSTCVSTSGDLANATTSGLAKASCDASSSSTLKDVWYKFTATATTHTITLTPSSGLDGVLALYATCSGTQLGCSDNGGGKGAVEKIIKTGLTVGTTYFIRIYSYGSTAPSTTTFSICVTAPAASSGPANDNCSNAIALTPNTSCISTSGTLANATVSGLSKASCDVSSYSSLKDVWYKFTATASSHTITLTPSSGLDAVLSMYSSCSGTQLGCSDNGDGPGGTEKIIKTGLTSGTTYYLRVYPFGSSAPTTTSFSICVLAPSSSNPPTVNCNKTLLTTIEGFNVYKHTASGAIMYKAKFAVDADGSPRAYGPNDSGLDYTANAGYPGNWWGVVTDASGNPVKQKSTDPYPGMYVSTTSLYNSGYATSNPLRYTNSETIPFYVIPSALKSSGGIQIGDVAYVYNTTNGKGCYAILADIGPAGKLGEGSIYLANQLGINSNPRNGGTSAGIIDYIIFPNSGYGQGTIPTVAQINSIGSTKLNAAGGTGLTSCIPAVQPPAELLEKKTEDAPAVLELAEENTLTVYPNPFDGMLLNGKFYLAEESEMLVKVYDLAGREIFSKQVFVAAGEFTLPFDEKLNKGMYILQAMMNEKQFVQRLIVR